jgi:hypothetical protein
MSVTLKTQRGNLALTSFTASNQGKSPKFAILASSREGTEDEFLVMVMVPGRGTTHLAFPHPLLVGIGRSLVVTGTPEPPKALFPVTVVGYEWVPSDDHA